MKMFEGPTEESLDTDARALIAAARITFRELEKLVKNIGFYGRAHQSVERFRESLFKSLNALLEDRECIEIQIGPYEFTLYDQTIYQNPSPERNFIYKFYMDGVRHLSFYTGITKKEIDDLIDVMLTQWDDPSLFEDDSVTLMWDKDFDHIQYVVIDSFSEDTKDGEEHQYTVAGVVEQVRKGGEAAVSGGEGGGPGDAGAGGGGGAGAGGPDAGGPGGGRDRLRNRSRRMSQRSLSGASLSEGDLERFEETPFGMDEGDFETLKVVIKTTGRETLEKFIEILFKVNMLEGASDDRDNRIVGLFDRIADLLLETGRVGELERLLRKVRRLSGPSGEEVPENVAAIERIYTHWSTPTFVEKLFRGVDSPEYVHLPSLAAITTLLLPVAVPSVVLEIGELPRGELRNTLMGLIPRLLPGNEMEVAGLLSQVNQELAHELLRTLRETNSSQIMTRAIRAGMENPDPGVRFEALSSLPLQLIGQHAPLIYRALEDLTKTVRSKALHLLARLGTPEVHQRILTRIDAKAFAGYDLDEKRRYFAAAALTGDANLRFLELFKDSGLLSSRAQDELRHCAAVALAIRLYKPALPFLQKETTRRLKSELVQQACVWALSHIEADRTTRTRQLYDIFFQGELNASPSRESHGG